MHRLLYTMQVRRWLSLVFTVTLAVMCAAPPQAYAGDDQGSGRGRGQPARLRGGAPMRDVPQRYHEPAFDRGYDAGYARGQADGRRGARYDPVESRDYRSGDRGYAGAYGSRAAYRTNYRAGFRQGYEDGYRAATR